MIHYAGEALHLNIAADAARANSAGGSAASLRSELAVALAQIEARLSALESSSPAPEAHGPPRFGQGAYFKNPVTKSIHWAFAGAPRTQCGWGYLGRDHIKLDAVPDGTIYTKICDKCLPVPRKLFRECAGATSDTD